MQVLKCTYKISASDLVPLPLLTGLYQKITHIHATVRKYMVNVKKIDEVCGKWGEAESALMCRRE